MDSLVLAVRVTLVPPDKLGLGFEVEKQPPPKEPDHFWGGPRPLPLLRAWTV